MQILLPNFNALQQASKKRTVVWNIGDLFNIKEGALDLPDTFYVLLKRCFPESKRSVSTTNQPYSLA